MYLIDSSAWIEFLHKTGSPVNARLRQLIADQEPVATTEPVTMEILAGARDQGQLLKLERMFGGLPLLTVDHHTDYEHAARLYRVARARGHTIRKLMDCLIAAVAIRNNATLVHADRDYEALKKVIPSFKTLAR
ncbi:PIN domain nuclease [Thermopolyspora sp. NPDC052614]|uniref:type II toxin-antitoxin system VapC family toxin n=1 Tax=Thermopolyspora sp. NPDC052614 TaxID=3155682 RepID=UPI0034295688